MFDRPVGICSRVMKEEQTHSKSPSASTAAPKRASWMAGIGQWPRLSWPDVKDRNRVRLVIGLVASFVISLILVVGLKVFKDRQDTLIAAEYELAHLSGALAAQVRIELTSLESLLDLASLVKLTDPELKSNPDVINARVKMHPYLQNLLVLDDVADVDYSYSKDPNIAGQAFINEDFFQYHQGDLSKALFISRKKQLSISKAIFDNEGNFVGVVVAMMSPDYLRFVAHRADIGFDYQLYLVGRDGRIILSSPQIRRGQTVHITNILGQIFPFKPPKAYRYTETNFKENVLVALQDLGTSPRLTILLVRPVKQILQPWRESLKFYLLIILAPTFFGSGICAIFLRQFEQKKLLEIAKHSVDTRLSVAVSSVRGGIWEWDLNAGQIYWSSSMYGLLGRTTGSPALTVDDMRALIHPDDHHLLDNLGDLNHHTSQGYEMVARMRHAHGHWVWVFLKGKLKPTKRSGDNPSQRCIVGMAIDVSEQKKTEIHLAKTKRMLSDALESIAEAFVLWDKNKKLVLCNDNFAEFYQIDPDTLKPGTSYDEIMNAARTPGRVLYRTDGKETEPFRETHSDEMQFAGDRWLHVSTHRTNEGGWVSVASDVTPLKEQERELSVNERRVNQHVKELQSSREALRKEADQRAELAVRYAAEKARAEAANQSKTEFLANMSHELRTPLNAIMGFAQIMRNSLYGPLGDQRYDDYVKDILSSSSHLLTIINDILDMSEIEMGRMVLERHPTNLRELVEEMLNIAEPKAFTTGIHIETDLNATPMIRADQRALKKVILNILSNAIKFTDHGGTITVRTFAEQDHAVLSIEDTGMGIAQKDLARIGRPFEQFDTDVKSTRSGTGLGLAIAKAMVELHSGTMSIQSRIGIGTNVYVVLPVDAEGYHSLNNREEPPEETIDDYIAKPDSKAS